MTLLKGTPQPAANPMYRGTVTRSNLSNPGRPCMLGRTWTSLIEPYQGVTDSIILNEV